jgi:hypothetical protein
VCLLTSAGYVAAIGRNGLPPSPLLLPTDKRVAAVGATIGISTGTYSLHIRGGRYHSSIRISMGGWTIGKMNVRQLKRYIPAGFTRYISPSSVPPVVLLTRSFVLRLTT